MLAPRLLPTCRPVLPAKPLRGPGSIPRRFQPPVLLWSSEVLKSWEGMLCPRSP